MTAEAQTAAGPPRAAGSPTQPQKPPPEANAAHSGGLATSRQIENWRIEKMRKTSLICGAALAAVSSLAMAQGAPDVHHYTTTTTQLGTLVADPDAKAVLLKDAPELVKNDQALEQASGMTLVEIRDALKPYQPNLLTDQKLAQIDADLAKLPPKN